ncbi:MAG: peptide-N-glycosidase F-related protein, partial [Ignavibacteriota bacterium]
MKKLSLIFSFAILSVALSVFAKTGDTTHVPVLDKYLWTYNGSIDNWAAFPPAGKHYEKILLRYKLTCPSPSCGQWDYTTKVILKHHTGVIDSILKDAPSFTAGGNTVDSFAFRHDTTRTYSYNSTTKTTDSANNGTTKIYFYRNPAKPFLATDSQLVWQAGYWNFSYDNTGAKKDSFYVKPDSVYHVTKVKAYFLFEDVVPYEIGRLITPYGQGFPKDWNFTWTMDVTDYAFMLHDSCELLSTYDGYSQGSLYSLSFDLIEGTPPREPYRIDIIYDGYYPWGDANNPISNYVKPKNLWVDPNAEVMTYRTFTTGHGNAGQYAAAEFTEETHSIWVDGVKKYDQHLWRDDCGANPVYPQTGTWTLSRAGWCPGDKVDPWDFDLTGMGKPSDSINVDYRFSDDYPSVGGAGYAVHTQVIYSKGPQYHNDVALMAIEAPTDEAGYRRTNPICSGMTPIIKIRNNSKEDLASLIIHYHVDDSADHIYNWSTLNDKVKYLESAEIILPAIDFGVGNHIFHVSLDEPNSGYDLYPNNNSGEASYTMPKIYSDNIYLSLRTDFLDGEPNGIRYELVDANDKVLYSQAEMADKTTIRDTFKLATGCYR